MPSGPIGPPTPPTTPSDPPIVGPIKNFRTNASDNVLYSDLDLSFVPHPLTGDLTPKINVDAISRCLHTIPELNQFDIPYDSSKATSVRNLLFQPVNQLTSAQIQTQLEFLIKKMEPRASIVSIQVTEDSEFVGYDISVTYTIASLALTDTVTFYLQRVR